MQDDTGVSTSPLALDDLEKAKGLWRFQIQRRKAATWAHRELVFLVYDDTDDKNTQTQEGGKQIAEAASPLGNVDTGPHTDHVPLSNEQLESDEDAISQQSTLSCAESSDSITGLPATASPGVLHQFAKYEESDGTEAPKTTLASLVKTTIDASSKAGTRTPRPPIPSDAGNEDARCWTCSGLPAFPHDSKTRMFRLYKPLDNPPDPSAEESEGIVCVHYVAVSYCWPEPVKDSNGNIVRPIGESKVRDLQGIQRPARALDDVLDRAVDFANSYGLRMIWIDQECLPQPDDQSSDEDKRYQQLGVQAMDIVYNRAIVTAGLHSFTITNQAQLDAIGAMIAWGYDKRIPLSPQLLYNILEFLLRLLQDRWYTRAWVIQEALSAGRSLCLVFRRAPRLVYESKFRINTEAETPRHPLDSEERNLPSEIICIPLDWFNTLLQGAGHMLRLQMQARHSAFVYGAPIIFTILQVAQSLHPTITVRQNFPVFHMHCGTVYGGRQRVNAATALTLLKRRHCRDVQDRLTILANMCNYDVRLDTDEVAKHCNSLRLALLALALLNGDTSILVPEVYRPSICEDEDPDPFEEHQAIGLLSPFHTDSKNLCNYEVQDGHMINPQVYKHAMGDTTGKGLRLPTYIWTVDDSLDLSPLKQKYAEMWSSMKSLRIRVEQQEGELHDVFETRRARTCRHFAMRGVSDQVKHEIFHNGSIASDSTIWHNVDPAGVRVQTFLHADRVRDVPEMQRNLAEIFFAILRHLSQLSTPHSIGVANSIWHSIRTNSVNKPEGESPRELPDFVNDELFSHPDVIQSPFDTLQLEKVRNGGYRQTWIIDRVMEHGVLWFGRYKRATSIPSKLCGAHQSITKSLAVESQLEPKSAQSIISRQISRQIGFTLWSSLFGLFFQGLEESTMFINISSEYWASEILHRGLWTHEAEEARVQTLASTFDVDGPCTVATTFNPDWEILPRPDLRSMSVCWVVEPVQDDVSNEGEALKENQEEKIGQGGEKSKAPEHRLRISEPENLSTFSCVQSTVGTPVYRVQDKVKGMWQIMDLPMQDVSFI